MRIVSSQLPRIRSYSNRFTYLLRCTATRPRSCLQLVHHNAIQKCRYATSTFETQTRSLHDTSTTLHSRTKTRSNDDRQHTEFLKQDDEGKFTFSLNRIRHVVSKLSQEQQRNPETWARMLEKYVPKRLRSNDNDEEELLTKDTASIAYEILLILQRARQRKHANTDILAHMIVTSRRKAGLWLCDFLLKNLATNYPSRRTDALPSNILWPNTSLFSMTSQPIVVSEASTLKYDVAEDWHESVQDPRYTTMYSATTDKTMDNIWSTLGSIVVQSINLPGDQADRAMNAVQLVLGLIHNLDLVPDDVYKYSTSPLTTAVQRPPILHLVSSRILTSLSDAAWRVQQDENIEKAASLGLSLEQIGRDPPGGRFRLKVRPLSPEVWLEFILWCCVEGGFAAVSARIIRLLQADTTDPWFAVTWSSDTGSVYGKPQIDWDRVKSRTGGTVGRIEGYSQGEPLAEVPSRTISTEVVLATVEAHIDMIQRVEGSRGIASEGVQETIVNLFSFLEPHDLPLWHFDYLSVRLLQTEALHLQHLSNQLKVWYETLTSLRELATIQQVPLPQISFRIDAVLGQSEFGAGLLHQVLGLFVQNAYIHNALTAFDDLQKLVDNSKLHAISSFLHNTDASPDQDALPKSFGGNPDFVDSHGQLPLYKLAALLDLATDTRLLGFGEWLIHNLDPDGPLIPKSAFTNAAMAKSLVRFAGISRDVQLLESVLYSHENSRRSASVSFLRTDINAKITLLDIDGVEPLLQQLGRTSGGGVGLSNIAHLASAILKLENRVARNERSKHLQKLQDAVRLLHIMLSSQVDGARGVYQRSIRTKYQQQVSHLLTMFKLFSDSQIAALAMKYQGQFRASNVPDLSPSVFNVFLETVMKTYGASSGMRLVDIFCTNDIAEPRTTSTLSNDLIWDEEVDDASDPDQEWPQMLESKNTWMLETSQPTQAFIPFASNQHDDSLQPGASTIDGQTSASPSSMHAFTPFVSDQPIQETDQRNDTTESQSSEVRNDGDSTEMASHDIDNKSELQFVSPFFSLESSDSAKNSNTKVSDQNSAVDDLDPVCVLNVRTIRLVIRKAKQEIGDRKPKNRVIGEQMIVLRWARLRLMDLGCDANTISNELEEFATEGKTSVSSSRAAKQLRKTQPSRKVKKSSKISRIFAGSPIMGKKRNSSVE